MKHSERFAKLRELHASQYQSYLQSYRALRRARRTWGSDARAENFAVQTLRPRELH